MIKRLVETRAKFAVSGSRNSLRIRGCAPGVTRTLDLRIRNPLLYPAELRAQLRSEVAAGHCDVQVFPRQRVMKPIMFVIGLAGSLPCRLAHGKSKKRCDEFVASDCAVQIRGPQGFR